MTHPLTPREKVEYWLSLAMDAGLHKQDFNLTEATDAILTALASGSGDHAELAALREHRITADLLVSTLKADKAEAERKLAEAEETNTRWSFRFADVREASGIGVKPMLSEVPGELRKMRSLIDRAADLMRQCTDPDRFEGASTLNVYANMRAWLSDLSKEAERG